MPDEIFSKPRPVVHRGGSGRTILFTAFLAFLAGAVLVGWLVWDGKLQLDMGKPAPVVSGAQTVANLPSAVPQAQPSSEPSVAQPAAAAVIAQGAEDQRLAALEARLAQLDLRAAAASGNAARAEGLLIAFAARRTIERGAPLGYLDDQLRLRFMAAQPQAVETVLAAARQPVTLDQLAAQLDVMSNDLAATPIDESGWARLRREVSGLFVIRRDDAPSTTPLDRLDRAKLMLRAGRIDEAIGEISRLPGAASASEWIVTARRHGEALKALDLIEKAAMLEPRELRDSSGFRVEQTSPLSQTTAEPVGSY